jgi:hypothetical protein
MLEHWQQLQLKEIMNRNLLSINMGVDIVSNSLKGWKKKI